jgi:broad specificity phosphatase PhoE
MRVSPVRELETAEPNLCRLALVRAGPTQRALDEDVVGSTPAGLSPAGRRDVRCMTRYWEWADAVVASPLRCARETAAGLAGDTPVALDPDLRPRHLGRFEGRSADELRAAWPEIHERWRAGDADFELVGAEAERSFRSRIAASLSRRMMGPHRSILVVSHLCVIRAIAAQLVVPLPPGRPWPAEMVLITRQERGRWSLGRRSSDPHPLRSPLERTGLSGRPCERPPEQHVERLIVRR